MTDAIYYLDIAGPLIAIVFGLSIKFIRKQSYLLSDAYLLVYLSIQLSLNILASYFELKEINNHWVYNINIILSFILFSAYFYLFISLKRIILMNCLLFGIIYFLIVRYIQPINTFPSYPYALTSFFIVCYTFLSFRQILSRLPTNHIFQLKEFWFLTGTLSYFACAFLVFISYNYLSGEAPENVGILWAVHNLFLFISCLLYLKSLTSSRWIPESS